MDPMIVALETALTHRWFPDAGDDTANWFIRDHGEKLLRLLKATQDTGDALVHAATEHAKSGNYASVHLPIDATRIVAIGTLEDILRLVRLKESRAAVVTGLSDGDDHQMISDILQHGASYCRVTTDGQGNFARERIDPSAMLANHESNGEGEEDDGRS